MATKKELQAEIDALRAEVAALRAQVFARGGWVQIVPAPNYPSPYYPYPSTLPTITCGTSTDNPTYKNVTLINRGA